MIIPYREDEEKPIVVNLDVVMAQRKSVPETWQKPLTLRRRICPF